MDLKNELDLLGGGNGDQKININNATGFMFPSFDLNGDAGSGGVGSDYSHFGKFDFFNPDTIDSASSSSNLLVNQFLLANQISNEFVSSSSSAPGVSNPNSCSSPCSSTGDSDHLALIRYLTKAAKNAHVNDQALFLSPPSSTSSTISNALVSNISINNANNSSSQDAISQDDLIDKRDSLWLYYTEFYAKNECAIDSTQGSFVVKQTKLSKSMQRKMFNLHQILNSKDPISVANMSFLNDEMSLDEATVQKMLLNQEYKKKAFRLIRSICERVLIDALVLVDQYSNQLGSHTTSHHSSSSLTTPATSSSHTYSKLWAEVRARGCQFLGPQMQEDVLNSILHALNVLGRWSRKNLINYVVWSLKLNRMYEKASRTNVGHVVQILYRAGCFKKLEKREPMMELKKEFNKYPALRKQHDMELIKIALEAGIRLTPEQWSQKFYGDSAHKSEMQSIIDKLQSQQTLEKLIGDVYEKLDQLKGVDMGITSNSDAGSLVNMFIKLKPEFEVMAAVNFEKRASVSSKGNEEPSNKSVKSNDKTKSTNSDAENFDEDISYEDMDGDEENRVEYSFEDFDDEDESGHAATSRQEHENGDLDENELKLQNKSQRSIDQEVKISWQMVIDSLRRMFKILSVYFEFAAKMSAILSANSAHHHHNHHHSHHGQQQHHGGYPSHNNLAKQQLPSSQMNRILKQNVPSPFMLHNTNIDPATLNKMDLYKQMNLPGGNHNTGSKPPNQFVNFLPNSANHQKASISSSSPPVPSSPVFKPNRTTGLPPPGFSNNFGFSNPNNLFDNPQINKLQKNMDSGLNNMSFSNPQNLSNKQQQIPFQNYSYFNK